MKRTIAVLLAVMMLTGVLTACSGSVGMDDGRAYGNVSTTPNGRVNGGDYQNGSYNGYGAGNSGMTNGSYGSGMTNGNSMYNSYGSGNASSGTGMTGGR